MNFVKKLFNVGLSASIENLESNDKKIGGINNVIILCRLEYSLNKYYFTASSIWADHLFSEGVLLWRSKKFKTKEEAVGFLTKEVRLAQKKFIEIVFFKVEVIIKGGEIIEFDEFVNEKWVRSKFEWDWDPISTMRDGIK